MNVLIVHAHPEPKSFTAALRDQAVETLQAQGHEVRVSDLYAMSWNPVASAEDFCIRENPEYLVYALEQRRNSKEQTLAADPKQRATVVLVDHDLSPTQQRNLEKATGADVLGCATRRRAPRRPVAAPR